MTSSIRNAFLGIGAILSASCATTSIAPPASLSAQDSRRISQEVRQQILDWGQAWVVGDAAETFELAPLFDAYYQDNILAFDTSDDAGQTVIRGRDEFIGIWEPFVRSWDVWRFDVQPDSIDIRVLAPDAAVATLFIDNYGRNADGTEFVGPAQGTVLMRRTDGQWRIVHEHISLPRKEP